MNEVPQESVFRRPQLFIGTVENDFAALDHDEFRIDQAERVVLLAHLDTTVVAPDCVMRSRIADWASLVSSPRH